MLPEHTAASAVGPSHLALRSSSFGWLWFASFCDHEAVIIRTALPCSVSCSHKLRNMRVVSKSPTLAASWPEVWAGGLGTLTRGWHRGRELVPQAAGVHALVPLPHCRAFPAGPPLAGVGARLTHSCKDLLCCSLGTGGPLPCCEGPGLLCKRTERGVFARVGQRWGDRSSDLGVPGTFCA